MDSLIYIDVFPCIAQSSLEPDADASQPAYVFVNQLQFAEYPRSGEQQLHKPPLTDLESEPRVLRFTQHLDPDALTLGAAQADSGKKGKRNRPCKGKRHRMKGGEAFGRILDAFETEFSYGRLQGKDLWYVLGVLSEATLREYAEDLYRIASSKLQLEMNPALHAAVLEKVNKLQMDKVFSEKPAWHKSAFLAKIQEKFDNENYPGYTAAIVEDFIKRYPTLAKVTDDFDKVNKVSKRHSGETYVDYKMRMLQKERPGYTADIVESFIKNLSISC